MIIWISATSIGNVEQGQQQRLLGVINKQKELWISCNKDAEVQVYDTPAEIRIHVEVST